MVAQRILQSDAEAGFILDKFPRTVAQAHALDDLLRAAALNLNCVLELRVDEDALLKRVLNRAREAKINGHPIRSDDTEQAQKSSPPTISRAELAPH